MSETLWLVDDYMSLLFSSKRNIDHVNVNIEYVIGKGSFGIPFTVVATPWEVGNVVTVIVNVFYASVKIYLSLVLLELLTIKEVVDFVIYNEVAVGDLQTKAFFRLLGTVANIGFAVDVIETRRFQTPLATVVEPTRL